MLLSYFLDNHDRNTRPFQVVDMMIHMMTNLLFAKSNRRTCFLIGILLTLVIYFLVVQYRVQLSLQYPYKWQMKFRSNLPPTLEPDEKALDIYDSSVPFNADFNCVKTKTSPSTTVCVFSRFHDVYISHDLEETGIWEPVITQNLLEILRRDQDSLFLDIGANIGYFTMLAAKMGHRVVAVEPVVENIQRIHRALTVEQLGNRVTIVKNAIADSRLLATVRKSGDNQGDARIQMEVKPCQGNCPPTVRTIVMNDLLTLTRNAKSVVMKIDSQGFEHRAFQNAGVLFNEVNVTYIFMEWLLLREHFVAENHESLDKFCVESTMRFLFEKDFRPYSATVDSIGEPLDPARWNEWPNDIIWHRLADVQIKSWLIWNHFHNWPPS